MIVNTEKFSTDGYIIDQDLFTDSPYRTCTSDYNGCGWIAAYNLRHALGQDVYYDDVRSEMDEMHEERVPGPTLMRVMRQYLKKYVPQYKETVGKEEATEAAAHARAGIFRYTEGEIPHFIAFVRYADETDNQKNVSENEKAANESADTESEPVTAHADAVHRLSTGKNMYRFFNVNDDIIDDVFDMYEFADEHFLKNTVIALTVE